MQVVAESQSARGGVAGEGQLQAIRLVGTTELGQDSAVDDLEPPVGPGAHGTDADGHFTDRTAVGREDEADLGLPPPGWPCP